MATIHHPQVPPPSPQPPQAPQTMIIQPGRRISAHDYALLSSEAGWRTELSQGVVVKMPLIRDLRHEHLASTVHGSLWAYVTPRRWGRCTLEQGGFNVTLPGEVDETIWGPDVSFSTNDRVVVQEAAIARGEYAPAPDLVVEIASPSQSRPEMRDRAARWLGADAHLVWIVWPASQTVDAWWVPAAPLTPLTPPTTVTSASASAAGLAGSIQPQAQTLSAQDPLRDALDGREVVPGFHLALTDLFV